MVSLTLVYTFLGVVNASAQTADHEAIKKALHDETAAFYARDADTWQAHWLHDSSVTGALVRGNGYRHLRGWEEIAQRVFKSIQSDPKPIRVELSEANVNIRQNGDLAWAEYDQSVTGEGFKETSHEYRTLVKSDGTWKIVSQVSIAADTFTVEGVEGTLNSAGYVLLTSGRFKEAIEVFSTNVRLFPDSWNVYDSLGEAYAAAGQKDLAIKNYERSLQLNPKNDNAKAELAKLKGQ